VVGHPKAFHDRLGGFSCPPMMGRRALISDEDTVFNVTLFSREVPPRLA